MVAVIAFDEALCHVYAESVYSFVHPESNDIFQFAADSLWSGSIDGLFPGMVGIGLGKSVIQCRLAVKEVFHIVSVACCVWCVYVLLGFLFFVGCPNVVITMLQAGISLLGL